MNEECKAEQELILKMKPFLRFKSGDVVILKSDKERTNPMVIRKRLDLSFDEDYTVNYFDSKGKLMADFVFDCALLPGDLQP